MPRLIYSIALLLGLSSYAYAATPSTQPLRFTVLSPDRQPAAGAKAVYVPAERVLIVSDGKTFDDDPSYTLATADKQGRLILPQATAAGPYAVCVLHDTGAADFTEVDLPADGVVRLSAWASLSSVIQYGPKVQAGEQCLVETVRPLRQSKGDEPHPPRVCYYNMLKTDADGRYRADRVPPGPTNVRPSRKIASSKWPAESPRASIVIRAGEKATLNLGGHGRSVVGRVSVPSSLAKPGEFSVESADLDAAPPPKPPAPPRPEKMSLEQYKAWAARPDVIAARERIAAYDSAGLANSDSLRQSIEVLADGTFRGEDLSPGEYRLFVYVGTPWGADGTRKYLAGALTTFTVPADDAAMRPIDLGTLTAERKTLVGQVATDFDVADLNGGRVRLADFRGRFVILNFWATWCGPCMAEVPNLKAIWAKYGSDPRFAMIDLCCDDLPDYPQKVVRDAGLAWPQGFLGGTDDPVQAAYSIGGWPAILLIDPEGKIVATGLRGELIETVIAGKLR